MRRFVNGILSFSIGAILLCLFSALQNVMCGHPLFFHRAYLLSFLFGGFFGLVMGMWRFNLNENRERNTRLNSMLHVLQNVNQLIVKENDRDRLLQGICNNLIEDKGYYHTAWIALLDESGNLITAAEKGWDQKFPPLINQFKNGRFGECVQRALRQSDIVLTKEPFSNCPDCPLSAQYNGRIVMTIRLKHEEKVYGVLSVSISKGFIPYEKAHGLLEEVAGDIAFALHGIEIEKEREHTKRELERHQNELQIIFDAVPAMIFFKDKGNNIIRANDAFVKASGISKKDLIGESCFHLFPNQGEDFWKDDKEVIESGKPKRHIIEPLETPEGIRWFQTDKMPYQDEKGNVIGVVSFSLDITKRKKAEDALIESEKSLRAIVENSLTGIAIVDADTNRFLYRNPEDYRIKGCSCTVFDPDSHDNIHPEDVEKVTRSVQMLYEGKAESFDIEIRFYQRNAPESSRMKWIYWSARRIKYLGKDAFLFNIMDITQAKEMEQLLRIQDKMASLGRVAAGIAHEIRNPLSGINIYLSTLERIYNKGENLEKVKKIIGQMHSASGKIESVIRRVMDFSKPGEPRFVLTDINQPIEEAISLASPALRKREINIEKSLDKDLPPCSIDSHLMEEVILNLITNAAEAMQDMDKEKRIRITSSMKRKQVLICVSDSGPGIPVNNREKIFDPFYTTKLSSTGIGLSICHRIIKDHGGSLGIVKNKWGGAELRIEIPLKR